MKLKGRLLRQRQEDERPVPVWIEFDSLSMTAGQAIKAAVESGQVPEHAVLVVLPAPIQNRDMWSLHCQAELIERERRRIEAQQQEQTKL